MNHEDFLNRAVKLANEYREDKKHSFAALIVRRNRVLSEGISDPTKTHPRAKSVCRHNGIAKGNGYIPETVHAELSAILGVRSTKGCEKATIYVARHNKQPSRPCAMCMLIIQKAGISKIVYHTQNGWAEEHL